MRPDRLRHLLLTTIPLLATATTTAPPALAAVTGGALTGGQAFVDGGTFVQLTDPIGAIPNNPFDDDNVRAWDEVQGVTLGATLQVDQIDPTVVSVNAFAAGSVISSHYVIFDPASGKDAIGSVTFDEPVLGVIRLTPQFNATDATLGNPTATYSIGDQSLENADTITISGNTVTFDINANGPGDAMRVITGPLSASNPIPAIAGCSPAQTTLTGVVTGGSASEFGSNFIQLCDPIGDVGDNNFESPNVFAFEEQQNVTLAAPLFIDQNNLIAAGETVSSFYVVFDPDIQQRVQATITFPDDIIAAISMKTQLQDSEFLGNASANYLSPNLLGLETGDTFTVSGADLMINFSASSPGDSIRVLLGSASPSLNVNPCLPSEVVLTGALTGGSAQANGGTFVELCDPIGGVGNNNYQSNDLFAFRERQGVPLVQDLDVDQGATPTVPAGTVVDSYYVAFDPGGSENAIGQITFPAPILGVMTSVDTLTDSDFLGNATGQYLNPGLRGLEEPPDGVTIMGSTLDVTFTANSPGDYIRVVTAASPPAVPIMGPIGMLTLIGCAAGLGRARLPLRSRPADRRDAGPVRRA